MTIKSFQNKSLRDVWYFVAKMRYALIMCDAPAYVAWLKCTVSTHYKLYMYMYIYIYAYIYINEIKHSKICTYLMVYTVPQKFKSQIVCLIAFGKAHRLFCIYKIQCSNHNTRWCVLEARMVSFSLVELLYEIKIYPFTDELMRCVWKRIATTTMFPWSI